MNPQQQQQPMSLLDRLVGNDGIKTDLRVRVIFDDNFFIKIGSMITLIAVVLLIAYFSIKSITDAK
jgi:hypothetical protein